MKNYDKEILKEKDPVRFIDLLTFKNFVAGQFNNNIPVVENRDVFEKWLKRHDKQLLEALKQESKR